MLSISSHACTASVMVEGYPSEVPLARWQLALSHSGIFAKAEQPIGNPTTGLAPRAWIDFSCGNQARANGSGGGTFGAEQIRMPI